jgi:hypothetical protein
VAVDFFETRTGAVDFCSLDKDASSFALKSNCFYCHYNIFHGG